LGETPAAVRDRLQSMARPLLGLALLSLAGRQGAPDIDRLIAALGSESIEARQKAEDRLVDLGVDALPALRKAAAGQDQEVRARAQSAIGEIDRIERERRIDAAEKDRLLTEWRKDHEKERKDPGSVFVGATQFEISAKKAFRTGLVLHTFATNCLYVQSRWERPIFDVVSVEDQSGKKLELERCGRCSPRTILVKETTGPLKVHIQGVHRWYCAYKLEFKDPKNGDEKKVGDFTIRVEWPVLKVTSRRGWPKAVIAKVGNSFTFDVKKGVIQPMWGGFGGGTGGGVSGSFSPNWWCACEGGPVPVVEKPKPELVRTLEATGGSGYGLEQVTDIYYTFYKPIEDPLDFTADASKE
jgi:hypothetical protein